ncbi:MAG: 1-acyl-sn-glycerol-3-phosphate acyltransferase, partial [Bacteroidales bacterium]
ATAIFTFGLGLIIMKSLALKGQHVKIPILYHPLYPYLSVSLLLFGLVFIQITQSAVLRLILFFYLGILLIIMVLVEPLKKGYNAFFTNRTARNLKPLTFLQIFQTLWTYFVLAFGSILLGILGLLFYGMVFLNIEKRKSIFHFCLMVYCKFYIWIIPVRITMLNPMLEDFKKPAVIISNHQSLIDMPILIRMYYKFIILTNDWVYNSPIFGHISKLADFYPVTAGIDKIMDKLKSRIEAGYSIIILPEGTRSLTNEIQRFHRGAFYIAEKLRLDIIPILICGTGDILKKGEFWGGSNHIIQRIYKRISFDDPEFGSSYSKRPKLIRKYLTGEFEKLMKEYNSIRSLRKKQISGKEKLTGYR